MSKTVASISMSLDGYIAGPNPTLEEPLGKNGELLHEWVVGLKAWRESHGLSGGQEGPNNEVMKESMANIGAVIMGRRMFSGGEGSWENDPNPDGWWGDSPPFKVPVFVLTNQPRQKVIKQGGTTFNFVTDGVEQAFSQAREAAGDKNISVAGGARTIQQFILADILDELEIHLVPILLGDGTKLLENLNEARLEKISVLDSPEVTHLKFRILK